MTRGDAEQPADGAVAGVPDGVVRQIAGLMGALRRLDEVLDREGPRTLLPLDGHPAGFRLQRLADDHDLSQVEADLLLLALAPALDGRYGRLFGRLRGDPTRRRPTVALAVELLGLTPAQRLAVPLVLDPGASLLRSGLLRLDDPAGVPDRPLPDRELAVDDRLAGFVTGSDALDDGLTGLVDVVDLARPAGPALVLTAAVRDRLDALAAGPPRPVHLRGPDGSGRQAVAESLARAWGFPVLLRIRCDRLPLDEPGRLAPVLRSIGREVRLRGAVPSGRTSTSCSTSTVPRCGAWWMRRSPGTPASFLGRRLPGPGATGRPWPRWRCAVPTPPSASSSGAGPSGRQLQPCRPTTSRPSPVPSGWDPPRSPARPRKRWPPTPR